MLALGNLCQSLSPPRGGGALLDKALYHAIENTANQNTEKLLYIRRYYTYLITLTLSIERCDLIPAEIM